MRKPFDVFIEGLELANNRGDWTPLELLKPGIRDLAARIAEILRQITA
jgi:hypothetical protein